MPRPFFETLRELRAGTTLEELADQLTNVVTAVRATGKAGELTLKLKVKPPRGGNAAYLMIEDSISTKIPKLDHGDTVFFHVTGGGLSRQDPGQQEMSFRSVASGKEDIDPETGEITQRSAS